MAGEKEKKETVSREHADYNGQQTERSPFEILDEVEGEGDVSFASISDEVESELQAEQARTEGEGTGLKMDKTDEERAEEEAAAKKEDEKAKKEKGGDEETEEKEETPKAEGEEEQEESEEEETEEESEEAKAESQPQWLLDKLKDINPDLDVSDEKAVQEAVDELSTSKGEVEKLRTDLEKEKEANKSFYELLEGSDPLREVSRFMWKHKVDFDAALTALDIQPAVDMEQLKKEDPDAYLEAVKANEKREAAAKEAADKQKARQKKLDDNADKSEENTAAFKKEAGIDDQAFNEMTAKVNPHIEQLADGLVTKEFLSILHRGLDYEDAVAKAREEGLTEGKNMKIEEHTTRKQGDKLPKIDTNTPKVAEKEEDDIWSEALKPEPRISDIK